MHYKIVFDLQKREEDIFITDMQKRYTLHFKKRDRKIKNVKSMSHYLYMLERNNDSYHLLWIYIIFNYEKKKLQEVFFNNITNSITNPVHM